jgi:hypothetical protein
MPAIACSRGGLIHGRKRRDERDLVVVGDQGELVGRGQPPCQERGALSGDLELGPGHRAEPIDHERQVERRPGPAPK